MTLAPPRTRPPIIFPGSRSRTTAQEPATATEPAEDAAATPMPSGKILPLGDVLDQLVTAMRKHIHFANDHQAAAVALWVAHTHILDGFDVSPRLAIRAPSKQAGKSKLLDVLNELVLNPWLVIGPTAAVLFRYIEETRPTILLDEADRMFERRAQDVAEVLQLLNAGHARGSVVPRVEQVSEKGRTKQKVHNFPAFAPVALAGIGTDWPDTIMDRAITVNMERKTSAETVARLRRHAKATLRVLRDDLAATLASVIESGFDAEVPDLPEQLSDRAQDGWEPLLAIANAAGGHWPRTARAAALALSTGTPVDLGDRDELIALRDMRAVFEVHDDPPFLATSVILLGFAAATESPWNDGIRPLSPAGLARYMRTFHIKSVQPHRGGPRGYNLEDVRRHWDRMRTSDESLAHLIAPIQHEEEM